MIKCKHAPHYKGVKYPRCNNGNPCEVCLLKYRAKQLQIRIEGLQASVVRLEIEKTNLIDVMIHNGYSQDEIEKILKGTIKVHQL